MRISPSEISFNDLDAFAEIYGQTSKFEKADYFYRAFEDQAPNLFTLRDRQQHSFDRRLMSHAFSRANILSHQDLIYTKTTFLMRRLKELAMTGREIPLFHALRCLTLDTIGEFAFGKSTGALQLENFRSSTFEAIDKATDSVPFVGAWRSIHVIIRHVLLTHLSFNIFPSFGRCSDGQHTIR
jgi:cytochrome P450